MTVTTRSKAHKSTATMTHSKATVRPDKATIKSLPSEIFIMIIEMLWFEDALELCHALHVPEQVAAQYCYYEEENIPEFLDDSDLKPNSYKFLFKNKRFQIIAESYGKTLVALRTLDLEFLKNFIEEFKPNLNVALSRAAGIGFTEAVKLLLSDSRVDPAAEDNFALIYAASYGHTEIVKLLLSHSRVDPSAEDNEALIETAEQGHVEIVKLLLSNSRLEVSVEMIQDLLNFAAGKEVKNLLKSYLKKKQSKE